MNQNTKNVLWIEKIILFLRAERIKDYFFVCKLSKTPTLFRVTNELIKVIKIGITGGASKTSLSRRITLCPFFSFLHFVSITQQKLFCSSNGCCNFFYKYRRRNYNKDYSEVKTLFKAGLTASPYLKYNK